MGFKCFPLSHPFIKYQMLHGIRCDGCRSSSCSNFPVMTLYCPKVGCTSCIHVAYLQGELGSTLTIMQEFGGRELGGIQKAGWMAHTRGQSLQVMGFWLGSFFLGWPQLFWVGSVNRMRAHMRHRLHRLISLRPAAVEHSTCAAWISHRHYPEPF